MTTIFLQEDNHDEEDLIYCHRIVGLHSELNTLGAVQVLAPALLFAINDIRPADKRHSARQLACSVIIIYYKSCSDTRPFFVTGAIDINCNVFINEFRL